MVDEEAHVSGEAEEWQCKLDCRALLSLRGLRGSVFVVAMQLAIVLHERKRCPFGGANCYKRCVRKWNFEVQRGAGLKHYIQGSEASECIVIRREPVMSREQESGALLSLLLPPHVA